MRMPAGTAVATGVGAAGAAAFAGLWQAEARLRQTCLPAESLGACLSPRLPLLLIWPLLVTAVGWGALRWARAPRAAGAAGCGAVTTAGALLLYEAFHPGWVPPPVGLAALLGAAGFAAGVAVILAPLRAAVRVPLILALLVPHAVAPVLDRSTQRADLERRLTAAALPLLVPDLAGWRVTGVVVRDRERVSTMVTNGSRNVVIATVRLPADFRPPQRCGPFDFPVPDLPVPPSQPCRPVAADHWVRDGDGTTAHLLRRDDALLTVKRAIGVAGSADLAAVAGALVEVSPRRLAELGSR
ncbi:hypothetical protein [Micromonospora rosaria]|nr:hypothetical protein [Micromonospora rosaria]